MSSASSKALLLGQPASLLSQIYTGWSLKWEDMQGKYSCICHFSYQQGALKSTKLTAQNIKLNIQILVLSGSFGYPEPDFYGTRISTEISAEKCHSQFNSSISHYMYGLDKRKQGFQYKSHLKPDKENTFQMHGPHSIHISQNLDYGISTCIRYHQSNQQGHLRRIAKHLSWANQWVGTDKTHIQLV